MKVSRIAAVGCAALLGAAALAAGDASAAKCVRAAGEGTGLTQDLAKAMATEALNMSIANYGGKAKGKAAMKCDGMQLLSTCKATQVACK